MADRDELLSHSYDGIEEYDNDLPKWWVWLFWLTIVFGVIRVGYYHFGPGMLQEEELAASMMELEEIRAAATPKNAPAANADSILALVNDSSALEEGKSIYAANCAACHMAEGQGLVGPNLTDDYWIHGGTPLEIREVIVEGVPAKGMIPWKDKLTPEQTDKVTAFIWTLRGSNPPNPKEPQGELVERSE